MRRRLLSLIMSWVLPKMRSRRRYNRGLRDAAGKRENHALAVNPCAASIALAVPSIPGATDTPAIG